MRSDFRLTEHYLIPSALLLLNICLMHFIYLLSNKGMAIDAYSIVVSISFALLLAGITLKKKLILGAAVMAYPLIIIFSLI